MVAQQVLSNPQFMFFQKAAMGTKRKYAPEVWRSFVADEKLSPEQMALFDTYLHYLLDWNERKNLTALTDPNDVILYHFRDSLSLTHCVDFKTLHAIADVGSGGGFPGVPLKIMFPHLHLVLIEVNVKKVAFLQELVKVLALANVDVESCDWRTFVRTAPCPVDLFTARASLRPDELVRIFKGGSAYKDSTLVYYASRTWQVGDTERPFLSSEQEYQVGDKTRRLIFFKVAGENC